MKKALFALLALGFVGNAQAQTSCAARLVAPFTPAEATKLCQEFSSAIGQSLIPSATNSFDLGSSTRTWRDLWLGRDAVLTASTGVIRTNTVDAADSKSITIASADAVGSTRGASLQLFGNESASPGNAIMIAGGSNIFRSGVSTLFTDTGGVISWSIAAAGDLIGVRSGSTISIQESTPASACMGVATPNGNTAVTVTTSCAVANARVFYTRVGAVANMGVISTTTNPNGTSFQFASTSATDTLASSVVWFIVKESA